MAKKKTVADQSRSGHVSSFTGGLNTDLHPMLQPNDTLTDCVNGTLITYNGNENMLQNDMGNYELKHAQLPEGYIPMGIKEHQGVLYIASWNPFEKKAQIGSYPSPKTVFGEESGNDYTINPIEIGDIEGIDGLNKEELAKLIFKIAEKNEDVDTSKHLVSELNFSSSEVIFTNDFDESTMLGPGDRYWLSSDSDSSYEDEFQNLTYFLIDKDKNKHYITNDITVESSPADSSDINKFNPVTFEHSGWLGAKYELKNIEVPDIDVTITENPKTSENYGTDIYKVTVGSDEIENLNNVEELWDPDIPANRVSNALYDIEVNDTYRVVNINTADAPTTKSTFNDSYENPYYKQPIYVSVTSDRIPRILYISLEDISSTDLGGILINELAENAEIDWLYIPRWYGEINKNQVDFSSLIIYNLIIPGKFKNGISGTIVNLYTISDNDTLYDAAVNTRFLDTSVRTCIHINTNTENPEFIIDNGYYSTKSCDHLEIFGKDPHIGPIPGIENGGIVYMEAPIRALHVASDISVVVGIDYLKQISSATDATPTIVVIGNEKYTNVKLNLSGNSTLWVTGNVGFTGKLPKNYFGSNVISKVTNDVKTTLVLSKQNTCVEGIIINSENAEVFIPEGITSVSKYALHNKCKSVHMPSTLKEIVVDSVDIITGNTIQNLFIPGNYRPDPGTTLGCEINNIYVSPNNLYYYIKEESLNRWGKPVYKSIYNIESYYPSYDKFIVDVNFNTDYKLLSDIFADIIDPHIITPQGTHLNTYNAQFEKVNDTKIVATYTNALNEISEEDINYYPEFSKIRVNTDCDIKKNVISSGQEWTITHNSKVDLSNTNGDITFNVLGVSTNDELNKFISRIVFPTLSGNETLNVTINSAANISSTDTPQTGIKVIVASNPEYKDYTESNTVEFTVQDDYSWVCYNIVPSAKSIINTYKISYIVLGNIENASELYIDAWNRTIYKNNEEDIYNYTLIDQQSILSTQTGLDLSLFFRNVITEKENANNLLGTVVLEGPTTMSYYKYNYNITSPISNVDNNTLAIETCLAVDKIFDNPEFGIKLSTPLFKYENDKLYVKNFFASLHRIDKLEFENPTPKANIILSTDTLQENCKVAVRVKYGEIEENTRFQILDNNSLSQEITVDKSDSYDITGYTFKQVGTKILIEDLNTKPVTISKNISVEDLSIYKYGFIPETRMMRVRLEWPQAIDQSDCYWTVFDLSGNNVANGIVNENLFFDNIDLNIDCSNLNDYWYIFSYNTPTKTYKRPLFAKTKVEYENGSFTGPDYSDYKNAYYDDLVNPENTTIGYKLENLPSELSDMQIWHKKRGGHFTWDPQYFKESPKALWWELMDEFSDNEEYYLGTRKYQNVTLDFENFGFVKGVTEYSVELNADDYDKPQIIQSYGVYDENNNKNTFWIPVGESIQKVVEDIDADQLYPFKKEYLIQNSYSPMEFDCSTILGAEDAVKVSRVCGWDKGKMLCVDKTGGETNDCSIALLDPLEYDPNSDSFKNGKIISGEGNFVSKILSRVDNLFVPIVARIKTDDNGFVFPVVQNPNWSYKETWDEARGKKNSDNKRSVWSSNGLGAIVHTKNNMAAIMATLISGFALIAAAIAEYVAAIVTAAAGAIASVFTFGTSAVLGAMGSTALFIVAMSQTAVGLSLVSAGFAELKKKEKVFKLFALRGKSSKGGQQKDLLVLPLWGKQEEHESKNRYFEGQVRYENVNWTFAEKLMLYLGSRIYARVYSDNSRCVPKFDEEKVINNKAFKLTVRFKNIDKKSGGISLKSLEKIFSTIYGIQTNNFKLKVSEIEYTDVNFNGKFDIKNKWIDVLNGENEYSTLEYQIENWCSTDKSGNSVPVVEDMDVDPKIENFVTCLAFDPASRCFYYSESSDETWYEEDSRWAFGPNRGGCKMRIKRNFRKKNGEVSNDKDWIDVGEFPRFNNDVTTPIAYPILPFCENEYTEDTKPNRSENIVNTYIKAPGKGNTPVYMETIDLNITKPEDIITKDCMNYLEYIFYDEIQKIQTTDSTN